VVQTGVIAVSHLGEAKIRAFAGVRRDDVVDDDGIVAAMRLSCSICASVPRLGSMSKLMRSKLPSMVGVNSRPRRPPERFIGPL